MEEEKSVRAFIAIEMPLAIIDYLKAVLDEFRKAGTNKIVWAKPENIHLTIKFLGNIEIKKIDYIAAILEEVAGENRHFNLLAKGVGAFPSIHNPRVIWLGIADKGAYLSGLHSALEEKLSQIGFEKEGRVFKPHLTLGRVKLLKDNTRLKKQVEKFLDAQSDEFTVSSIVLFKSILSPEGAIYTKLREAALK